MSLIIHSLIHNFKIEIKNQKGGTSWEVLQGFQLGVSQKLGFPLSTETETSPGSPDKRPFEFGNFGSGIRVCPFELLLGLNGMGLDAGSDFNPGESAVSVYSLLG